MSKTLNALHPRNPHQGRYDLQLLCQKHPALTPYITTTPAGLPSIDFSEAKAVQALNAALLATYYQVSFWQLPEGYLCPPIPGRADYIHYAADLVAELHNTPQTVPTGKQIRMLDIGCGGGLLCEPLARLGAAVTGVDAAEENIAVASAHAAGADGLVGKGKARRGRGGTERPRLFDLLDQFNRGSGWHQKGGDIQIACSRGPSPLTGQQVIQPLHRGQQLRACQR